MQDVRATIDNVLYFKLTITGTEPGATEDEAFVSFKAESKVIGQKGYRQKGSAMEILTERSRFLREDGRWLFRHGDSSWEHEGPANIFG